MTDLGLSAAAAGPGSRLAPTWPSSRRWALTWSKGLYTTCSSFAVKYSSGLGACRSRVLSWHRTEKGPLRSLISSALENLPPGTGAMALPANWAPGPHAGAVGMQLARLCLWSACWVIRAALKSHQLPIADRKAREVTGY